MKLEIDMPDLHEIANKELKEKDFMQCIQETKKTTHKLLDFELKKEFEEWDTFSDEAFLNFEGTL